ncbi:TetR/AcrR family transcriptional regulator [Lentzea nigeriaca]|uniref:TetR/AcrR family transcriptional regulator n=1 Tax=Lentzea nigeriaca TaxID=1128665 RepID=UPI003556CFDD
MRSQILAATMELVARDGVTGLRYEEIGEFASVNGNNVYRNFPGRAELVKDALLQYAEDPRSARLRRSSPCLVDFLVALAVRLSSSVGRAHVAGHRRGPGEHGSGRGVSPAGERFRLSTATSSPCCCPGRCTSTSTSGATR